MGPAPRTDDLLSRHGAFLRRLAGELTRCDADAEDLVQSTWVEALCRPPSEWKSPRGWLGQVARRLAGKRARTDSRRTRREVQAARREQVEADADLPLVLGELGQALGSLSADQRRVIIARYFEGLELKAIAEAEGVALSTIKDRLARAHRQLRLSLDGDLGRKRWMSALAPLCMPAAPPFVPPSLVPTTAGVLAVTAATKLIAAAGVAGLLYLGLGTLRDVPTDALVPEVSEPDSVVLANAEPVSPAATQERTVVADDMPPEEVHDVVSARVPEATLQVHATDLYGAPVSGIKVFAAPEGLPLNLLGTSNSKGRFDVRWRDASAVEMVVGLKSNGRWLGGLRRHRMGPGSSKRLDLALHHDLAPSTGSYGFITRTSASVPNGDVIAFQIAELEEIVEGLEEAQHKEPAPRRPGLAKPTPLTTDEEGFIEFSALQMGEEESNGSREFHSYGRLLINHGPSLDKQDRGKLRGTVRDAFGDPVADVLVTMHPKMGQRRYTDGDKTGTRADIVWSQPDSTKRTDKDGAFEFELNPGDYTLKVDLLDGSKLREKVVLRTGSTTTWEGALDLGTRLWGQTVQPQTEGDDSPSKPIISATAPRPGGLWIGVTRADKEGNFSIPYCPASTLDVDIEIGKNGPALMHIEGVSTDVVDWRIDVDPALRAAVTYQPLDLNPGTAAASELRVWDRRTGRGWSGKVGGRLGEPRTIQLPSGDWDLEVRPSGAADVRPVQVNVLDPEPLDMGPINMPSVGWLDLPAGQAEVVWTVQRESDSVRVFHGKLSEEEAATGVSIPLAPGKYVISSNQADSEPRTLAIQASHHANW